MKWRKDKIVQHHRGPGFNKISIHDLYEYVNFQKLWSKFFCKKLPDFWRNNFHDYGEEDSKPGLSKKVVGNQAPC